MADSVVNPHAQKWAHLKPNQHCSLVVTPHVSLQWSNHQGQWHRVDESGIQDGPAVIWKDETQFWCIDGKVHRIEGPAVTYPNGGQSYYLDGEKLTQEEWCRDPRVQRSQKVNTTLQDILARVRALSRKPR